MAPADAAMYWARRGAANDQFLLYAFDAPHPVRTDALVAEIRRRAAAVGDLHLDVQTVPGNLDFPRWVPAPIADDQIVAASGGAWIDVLAAVGRSMRTPSDRLWRIHVFDDVTGLPEVDGRGRVAVLQVSHALGDGRRASAIARAVFGGGPPPAPNDAPVAVAGRRLAALRSGTLIGPHLVRATARGLGAWAGQSSAAADHGPGDAPATRVNVPPGFRRELRTLTVPAESVRVPGRSVTVGALVALADVLPAALDAPRGEAAVELTVALDLGSDSPARNRFQNVTVGLHAHVRDRVRRAGLIADEIAAARARASSPGRLAARRAADSAPAVLAAAAVRMGAAAAPPDAVAGWTVVSSVNRGPADLALAGGRVRFTAGFPALSRTHSLTHGVHGIGGAVTLSVTAGAAFASDVDDYVEQLARALGRDA